jgi:uncharacterized membrane protein
MGLDSYPEYSKPRAVLGLSWNSIILALILVAVGIRLFGVGNKQLWVDEIIQVIHSSPDSIKDVLKGVAQDKGGAPLDYIVQHYVFKLFGRQNEFSARFHAVLFGSISVVLFYVLSIRLLKNPRIAALSVALFAFYPFHHHYSQEGRPYALFLMLVLISFLVYFRSRTRCTWTLVLLMFFLFSISFYTSPFTAMVIAVLFAINVVRKMFDPSEKLGLGFFAPLISGLPAACLFIPWLLYSLPSTKGHFPNPLSFRMIPEAIQGLGDGSYPVSILLFVLAGFGVVYLRRNHQDALRVLACWILAPIPFILFVLQLRSYFFSPRQLLFLTPAIILLAACGIEFLWDHWGQKAIGVLITYIVISLFVIAFHYPDKGIDYRGAGHFLRQNVQPGDRVFAPNALGLLSFYFPDIYAYEQNSPVCPSGCNRLFYIDTPYASAADKEALRNFQDRMQLKKKYTFRKADVFLFKAEGSIR